MTACRKTVRASAGRAPRLDQLTVVPGVTLCRSVKCFGMYDFHKPMVVAVVDGDSDHHWTGQCQRFRDRRRDLVGLADVEARGAEGLRERGNVNGTKLDSRST